MNEIILKKTLISYYNETIKNKKYLLFFSIFLFIISITMVSSKNFSNPRFEIIIFLLVLFLGLFLINYYTKHIKELHKVAFIAVLCFGIFLVFITPIFDVPDEGEHFIRAELVSQGELFPNHFPGQGFKTIQSFLVLFDDRGSTVFESNSDNQVINHSSVFFHSAFQQNPFFGYLAQAIGIFFAKIFDLNQIWLLWLGRLFNLVLYSALISIAVKKTPILKIPFIAVACLPLAVYQGASMSIDSMINGLALLIIAYFFYMIKSKTNSLTKRELAIFSFLCLILGLCKLPYLAFIFLILIVPNDKFEFNKYYYGLISIVLVGVIGLIWSNHIAVPAINNSYRIDYIIANNVSSTAQINNMISHPRETILLLFNVTHYLPYIQDLFVFSYAENAYDSGLINGIYTMFFGAICFLYPYKNKISNKLRVFSFCIVLISFYGIFLSQYITWSPVGSSSISGIQARYFIPLLSLLPFVFGINNNVSRDKKIDLIIIIITFAFLGSGVLATAIKYY
ncbi:MAG: DUF2142 domain-containing protein [Methanobacteriaceae archaeon]|jgi:uncharacterized membrane protein|nr:DUF2142 domain-containing protein [Methanobacteriaceae archaeon]